MNEFFATNNSSVNAFNYYRVLILGILDILVTLPISILGVISGYSEENLQLYGGWTATHEGWSPGRVSTAYWKSHWMYNLSVRTTEWVPVVLAFVFFFLFGLTEEARRFYNEIYYEIAKKLGFMPVPRETMSDIVFGSSKANATASVPWYVFPFQGIFIKRRC